jgi:hypothetical protein
LASRWSNFLFSKLFRNPFNLWSKVDKTSGDKFHWKSINVCALSLGQLVAFCFVIFLQKKVLIFFTGCNVHQGCQMVSFQTKNPNLGTLWRTLEWKVCYIFWSLVIF